MERDSIDSLTIPLSAGPMSEKVSPVTPRKQSEKSGSRMSLEPLNASGVRSPPQEMHRQHSFIPSFQRAPVNPFVNHTLRLPWFQQLKVAVLSVTLFPLRLALSGVAVLGMWSFACITLMGLKKEDYGKPMVWWRRKMKHPITWFLRLQLFAFGFMWIKVKGKRAKKSQASIMVSNHVSPFEPFFLVCLTRATPVQRVEDSTAPIIGTIQKAMQIIFVDRNDPNSRKNTLDVIAERGNPASPHPQVLIFPEGTCNNQRALITFKHGPFAPGLPVQPVVVRYPWRFLDPSFPAVSPKLLRLAIRMMCQFVNWMEVEFLDVYVPNAEEKANPGLFAENVRRQMATALGIPCTQHAFEDVALQYAAMKMKLPAEVALVEWNSLRKALEIDAATAKEYLKMFGELDKNGDGRLSYEEFAAGWQRKRGAGENQPSAAILEAELARAFSLFDMDGLGSVDFRQFLTGLAVLNGMGREGRRDALKFAFSVLDSSDKGEFTREELQRFIRRMFPQMSQAAMDNIIQEADPGQCGIISRDDFLSFAEKHDDILNIYQAMVELVVHPAFLGFEKAGGGGQDPSLFRAAVSGAGYDRQ